MRNSSAALMWSLCYMCYETHSRVVVRMCVGEDLSAGCQMEEMFKQICEATKIENRTLTANPTVQRRTRRQESVNQQSKPGSTARSGYVVVFMGSLKCTKHILDSFCESLTLNFEG